MVNSRAQSDDDDRTALPTEQADAAIASTEAYETDEGIVLYDAENPLGWIQSTAAVRIDDAA